MKNPVKDNRLEDAPDVSRSQAAREIVFSDWPGPRWAREALKWKHRALRGGDKDMDAPMMELTATHYLRSEIHPHSVDRASDVPTQRTERDDFIVYGFRVTRTKK